MHPVQMSKKVVTGNRHSKDCMARHRHHYLSHLVRKCRRSKSPQIARTEWTPDPSFGFGLECETTAQNVSMEWLMVWTADGRPLPAVTRTLQYAADIASCRVGQKLSAKPLRHRWKLDILRRRAAMTRAFLPNPSARAEWLLAGLRDRATGSEHPRSMEETTKTQTETGTDTTAPDDENEDIASFTSQQTTAIQTSNL